MPGEEKPYRVYRGGRQKGKVPLQTRPARGSARARRKEGSDYRGPGPVKERRKWSRGRKIAVVLGAIFVLIVVWAVASYFSLRSGIKSANERLPAGAAEALDNQNSLILSTPTNILLLGTDHANQPGHEGQ